MPKQRINYRELLPTIRIVLLDAADIYFNKKYQKDPLVIENPNSESFDKHFNDLMPPNLDLIHLDEIGELTIGKIAEEYFTYDIVNVEFGYSLKTNSAGERVYISNKDEKELKKKVKAGELESSALPHTDELKEIRKDLYTNGFQLNGKEYVRYKRSAGAAKSGNCLFIRKDLFKKMNKWTRAGLDEEKDKCFNSLTSYEAYKALSLSSLIHTFKLNPYNILFVKDFDNYTLKDQDVVKITFAGEKTGLVANREKCDVTKVNLFDGEGLLDFNAFPDKYRSKGMVLLRNRYFKCCAFNTNLQRWFKHNNITKVEQLHGYTLAKNVKDIVLVASESCLKYFKLAKDGWSLKTIERWCDAVSDENNESLFGIVKTDKPTRFFGGDMVETTYQFLNTLELNRAKVNTLIEPYVDYIQKIRDLKNTPEFVRLYLDGEMAFDEEEYEDDSEGLEDEEDLFDYSEYTFKNKVCLEMLKVNSDIIKTALFKDHIFNGIIPAFRLKLYGGRVLIHGTYATLFGNPLEFLKYIILKDGKPLFGEGNITSTLGKDQIYCSFFKEGQEIAGSRAPHITMGNVLYSKNTMPKDLTTWFNLTPQIVVVDAINNNVQQRLNGADYDSDSLLLTDEEIIVKASKEAYKEFPVPYVAFSSENKPMDGSKSLEENLSVIDGQISNNKTGEIVNLSQQLNSHLWNDTKRNSKERIELYGQIAALAALSGAEIDSAKRSFPFSTTTELTRVRKFINDKNHDYSSLPHFFYYIKGDGEGGKPRFSDIETHISTLKEGDFFKTTMDTLWFVNSHFDYFDRKGMRTERIQKIAKVINKDIVIRLSKSAYNLIEKTYPRVIETRDILNKAKKKKKKSRKYDEEKREFQNELRKCYQDIRLGINSVQKAKAFINKIEKEVKNSNSVIFVFLFIVSTYEKELGYSLKDLFKYDDGVLGLHSVFPNKKHDYVLFDRYYYEKDPVQKLISTIFTSK